MDNDREDDYNRENSVDLGHSSLTHAHTLKRGTSYYINWNQQPIPAILAFYTSLVRLLASCASRSNPSMSRQNRLPSYPGQMESYSSDRHKQSILSRTINILQNLIKAEEIVAILSFKTVDVKNGEIGLGPFHKEAALLFLDRVYGIPGPELQLQLLNKAFLPDIKLALQLAEVSQYTRENKSISCL